MLEQTFADQVAEAESPESSATNQSTNLKKRKAETNAAHQLTDPDDFDDLYYSNNGKGKKSKGGVGYAGNIREDVRIQHRSYSNQL